MMDFYCNTGGPRNEVAVKPINDYDWRELYQGKAEMANPLEVKIVQGKKFYDALYFYSDPCNLAISDKLKNEFQDHNLTGWRTYDLKIQGSDLLYHGFIPTGKCGPLKNKWVGDAMIGFYFDLQTWDGTDFFVSSDIYRMFFTSKVKEILERNKVNNFIIENIKDVVRYQP